VMSHEEMLDAVAAYALGAVSPNEAREVSEHLRACPECSAEYGRLRPAVTALAYSAEACASAAAGATVASPLLKGRIMKAIRTRSRAPYTIVFPYALAAAALVVAVIAGIYNASLGASVARERAVVVVQSNAIAALLAPAARRVPFSGGEVVVGTGRLYIVGRLPMPESGKVYQVWTLAKGARRVAPSVTFRPALTGLAVVAVPHNPAMLAALAISVEPSGGSKQPTTKPVVLVHLGR
jgi:anti-sigma-K factor RskA